MVDPDGSGWSIASAMASSGSCSAREFAEWWAYESVAARLHHFLTSTFQGARIVERHGEFLRYQLPETDMPLSEIFRTIEAEKTRLQIVTYSLSQTTLEQIFNVFAAQQDEEVGAVRGLLTGAEDEYEADDNDDDGSSTHTSESQQLLGSGAAHPPSSIANALQGSAPAPYAAVAARGIQ
jgi:hypothetical protein